MEQSWIHAIYGGLLVGLAAAILLATYGRVLGVSGIVGRISDFNKYDTAWRALFFIGTVVGGYLGFRLWPEHFATIRNSDPDYLRLAVAGVIVGVGTKMANGCTSGHGVCGIGRLSPRSVFATMTFIGFGMATVAIIGR